MRIGINGYEAIVSRVGYEANTNLPNRVGSSEYAFELLKEVYKFSEVGKTLKQKISRDSFCLNDFFIYLPGPPTPDLPKENDNWHYVVIPNKNLWTFLSLSKEFLANKEKLDVFFSPTHYLPLYCPCPSVISIMDLSYLHFPEMFKPKDLWQLKLWTKYSIGKAQKVLTISCASKNDIIKEYGANDKKVTVTYPGIKVKNQMSKIKSTSQNSKVLEKHGISTPYILFVGTIQPRKNIERLVEAFSLLCHSDTAKPGRNLTQNKAVEKDPSTSLGMTRAELVIIGKPGWMYEEIYQAPKKFGVEERVKFLEEVNDEELAVFYKNALVLVLPSLYEGFGLPVLEAMQYGCPVITSNVSSLPEAGGEAALYVNPEDVGDIADKIARVLSDEKLRKDMIAKGYQQVKKFSWEKTARETLKVLEEVAK